MAKKKTGKPEYRSVQIRLVDFKRLKDLAHKSELKLIDLVTKLILSWDAGEK